MRPLNPNHPLVDPRTGKITGEWLKFFESISADIETLGSSSDDSDDGSTPAPDGSESSTPPVIGGSGFVTPSPAYLGGSRNTGPAKNPAVWTPVVDFVPFVATVPATVRIRVELWARSGGVSAQARIFNVTTGTPVTPVSAVITATSPTETTFNVSLLAGHTYRLEVLSGTNNETVYAIGQMEFL